MTRRWKRLFEQGSSTAVGANEEVVSARLLKEAEARIRELERAEDAQVLEEIRVITRRKDSYGYRRVTARMNRLFSAAFGDAVILVGHGAFEDRPGQVDGDGCGSGQGFFSRFRYAITPAQEALMRLSASFLFILVLLCPSLGNAQQLDLKSSRLVDLTHPFNAQTLYWPTSPSAFELQQLAHGPTEGGYFYAANAFCAPEHGGTHLDAPIHFAEGRLTADQIPLERLIGPVVVLDISASAAQDPDYRLTREDVLAFERRHGRIEPGTIVLLRTGWSRHWPNRKAYLGDDTPGDASRLHFPSFGEDAARLLVEERRVDALGADVASIDYGQSKDFKVHRIAAAQNVVGLENLTNLGELPPSGAAIIALPMKIEGGSGGPVRVIALVPPM